ERERATPNEPNVCGASRGRPASRRYRRLRAAHVQLTPDLHPGPAGTIEPGIARDLRELEPQRGLEIVHRAHQSRRAMAVLFAHASQENDRARFRAALDSLSWSGRSATIFAMFASRSFTLRGS